MRILAVDTSAVASSSAILDGEKIRGSFQLNAKLTHSQTIMPMIESVLKCSATPIETIDAFAVTAGPGSFTGIRIGVSAVKGMSMALDKPCIAVSTLESLAYNLLGFTGIVCAVMDARREQVYNALFQISGENPVERLTPDRAISIEALGLELKSFKKSIFLVGDGADLCYTILKDNKRIRLAPEHLKFHQAVSVGIIGQKKLEKGEITSPEKIMPIYLRLPQAQRELIIKQKRMVQNDSGWQ